MKALVTGAAGFAGKHLTNHLLRNHIDVTGSVRKLESAAPSLLPRAGLRLYECDMTDPLSVEQMVRDIKPDLVFHLAAQSYVPYSLTHPMETIYTNLACQTYLLEAVLKFSDASKTLIACSSDQYGAVNAGELPVREDTPFRPLNPYAVSKITQEISAVQYYRTYKLPIVVVRTFNYTGPGQNVRFAASNFARQISEIEAGLKPPVLQVGNLDAVRDYTDVRDVAGAYLAAIAGCEHGEPYNVASGRGISIRELVGILLGLSKTPIQVVQDKSRLRVLESDTVIGDYTKFNRRTGWAPRIPIEQTMEDLLNYWRAKIRQQSAGN